MMKDIFDAGGHFNTAYNLERFVLWPLLDKTEQLDVCCARVLQCIKFTLESLSLGFG
jgi:hypothetical protein